MQRIIFASLFLLLTFPYHAFSAVIPSYEGWKAADEKQVRYLVGAILHEEALRPAHFVSRNITLKVVPSQIGLGSFYRAGTLYIGTRPHAGTGNEWFNHSLVHEYSHALTDFSGDGNIYLPQEISEALAETYAQYIATTHLQRIIAVPRGRMAVLRKHFNVLPEKPDLAFRETTWQQSQTHSCVSGECESSYAELAYVLYRLVSAASMQMENEDWETFYQLTLSLHEQWILGNKQRLDYPAIYEALNRAFSGVSIDGLPPGDWLATRRTFSQLKTGKLASIEALGAYWNGSQLFVGPFNPGVWTLRLRLGIAPKGINETVRSVPITGGPYQVLVLNSEGRIVFSEETSVNDAVAGQVSGQLPHFSHPGLYRIEVVETGNLREIVATGRFNVLNSLGEELVSSSVFVQSVSPQGAIISQSPQVSGCKMIWSQNGLTKLDNCTGLKVFVNGEEFSLDAKRRVLVTNSANRWPVLRTDPQALTLKVPGSNRVAVYNVNPQSLDSSFTTRVTHDSGSSDKNWCSTNQTGLQVVISANPTGGQYLRRCKVCLETNLGSSTACVDVTYDPFSN